MTSLEDYPYFTACRRSQLESSTQIAERLKRVMEFQASLPLSGIIAPNIVVSRSFDSVEAVVAKNFIRQTRVIWDAIGDARPVYATLALSHQTLLDRAELESFLNDITLLDNPPNGFYLLIAASSSEARTEIFNADVVAAWMAFNYSLKLSGYTVINGYADRLAPFLGAAGGDVGCAGWFNTLRTFSLERFAPAATGGRLPVQRYLSARLLNRLTFIELNALRNMLPNLLNSLPHDADYPPDEEPPRNREVLQSWETLVQLGQRFAGEDVAANLQHCEGSLNAAEELYAQIAATGYPLDAKSNSDHIAALREGIELFKEIPEL
ncbi:MAG: hypothetical protein HZA90_07225 [Verrucomicrobia bacterium]|nr:hypothetical protein [Verrucomicrobiota bacterium]